MRTATALFGDLAHLAKRSVVVGSSFRHVANNIHLGLLLLGNPTRPYFTSKVPDHLSAKFTGTLKWHPCVCVQRLESGPPGPSDTSTCSGLPGARTFDANKFKSRTVFQLKGNIIRLSALS